MFAGIVEKIKAMEAEAKAKAEADQVAKYNLWKKPATTPDPMATPMTPWDASKEATEINARRADPGSIYGSRGVISRAMSR